MQLGGTNSYFGTGSDLMSIYDFETGERRLSVLADTARMAHLCDGLPNIDFIMSAAHPHDVDAYASYLECFRAMVSNTTKPMVMTAAGVEDLEVMWKIAAAFRGGEDELREKPYFIQYGEPVSPLQHAARGARQAALLRRQGHPAHLLAGPHRRRHGADDPGRPHRAGRRRVALRRRPPPAARAGRPAAHRHGPGQARHEHVPGALQLGRVLHDHPRHHRDGQVDGHPQLGLRRHQRLAVRGRQRRHRHHRAHAALHAGRLQPQPRHRLPRLRPHRRRRARRAHRRGHLHEPARARGHRGQRRDARPGRHRGGRPRRRLPPRQSTPRSSCAASSGSPRSSTATRRRTGRPPARSTATDKAHQKLVDIMANHTPEPLGAEQKQTMDELVDAYVAAGK